MRDVIVEAVPVKFVIVKSKEPAASASVPFVVNVPASVPANDQSQITSAEPLFGKASTPKPTSQTTTVGMAKNRAM